VGHSIGGAFAAEAARAFPGVAVLNDRSFGRLSATAWCHLVPWALARDRVHAMASVLARWAVYEAVAHLACWELDTARHWLAIPASRKAVVFHERDGIIPLPVQLHSVLAAEYGLHAGDGVSGPWVGGRRLGDESAGPGHGGSGAGTASASGGLGGSQAATADDGSAAWASLCFGLGAVARLGKAASSLSEGGGGRGAGQEAHGRELSLAEEARLFDRLLDPLMGAAPTSQLPGCAVLEL